MRHLDNDVKYADDIRQQDQKRGFREKGGGMWMRETKYADKKWDGTTWDEEAGIKVR